MHAWNLLFVSLILKHKALISNLQGQLDSQVANLRVQPSDLFLKSNISLYEAELFIVP